MTTPIAHTAFSTTDPWTQVLARLWAILEADATFALLVKPGNRIKFADPATPNPIKTQTQDGDYPEVCIEPTTDTQAWAFSSQSAEQHQAWSVKIAAGPGLCLTASLAVKWRVLSLLFKAGDSLGLDFVVSTRITVAEQHTYDPVENRGTMGWTSLITLVTVLEFPKNIDGTLAD